MQQGQPSSCPRACGPASAKSVETTAHFSSWSMCQHAPARIEHVLVCMRTIHARMCRANQALSRRGLRIAVYSARAALSA